MADLIADMQLFLAIADHGGITTGAEALGLSPPAVSRRLAALEARLGVRLAHRTARRFQLTDEGEAYRDRGRDILIQVQDAEAEVSDRGTGARGRLRVSAPSDLGRRRIAAVLAEFAAANPGLEAHLVLSDAGLEVGEDGIDVAIRVGLPDDPSLIAHKLLGTRRVVCAAPSYLARHGTPAGPNELLEHNCLRLTRRNRLQDRWAFTDDKGNPSCVKVMGTLSSSDGEVLRDWCLAGLGISLEAEWDVQADLASGRLVGCLEQQCAETIELYATYQTGKPVPPRVRLFVQFVGRTLGADST